MISQKKAYRMIASVLLALIIITEIFLGTTIGLVLLAMMSYFLWKLGIFNYKEEIL